MITDENYEMVMEAVREALEHYRTTNLDYYLKTLGDIEQTLRRAMEGEGYND